MRQPTHSCLCQQALKPSAGCTVRCDNQQLFCKQDSHRLSAPCSQLFRAFFTISTVLLQCWHLDKAAIIVHDTTWHFQVPC